MSARPTWQLREVSPDEYRRMQEQTVSSNGSDPAAMSPQPKYIQPTDWHKTLLTMAVVVVCLLVGFAAGINYQKLKTNNVASGRNSTKSSPAVNTFGLNGVGRRGMRRSGGLGSVTAIDNSSITIQNARSGSDQTFRITNTTTVTANGTDADLSVIKIGDTVLVRTSSADASTAASIILNPGFGGSSAPDGTGNSSSPDTPDSGISTQSI